MKCLPVSDTEGAQIEEVKAEIYKNEPLNSLPSRFLVNQIRGKCILFHFPGILSFCGICCLGDMTGIEVLVDGRLIAIPSIGYPSP